ncbi:MAG: reverse transcriptase family protein, partial [Candidatus Thiodiazotropha sp.]
MTDAEFLNFICENDLIFCSETWQRSNDNFDIQNYHCISVPRPESLHIRGKGKRGHGGICLYINNNIYEGVEVMERISEGFLWIKLKKAFFSMQHDLFICFCYIPPKDSVYFKTAETDLFDILEKGIRYYSDYGLVGVFGDLNCRTGLLSDEPINCEKIDKYIDSLNGANLIESQNIAVGRRFSLDKKTDSSGLKLLGICKEAGLRIVNGRLGSDKGLGHFTYQSVLGKSVIDYVLFQPEMFDDVTYFAVHDIFTFSDHAPVQVLLKSKRCVTVENESCMTHKLVWDKTKLNCFRSKLSDSSIDLDLLVDRIVNENLNIDDGVENFGAILYNNASQVFGQTKTVKIGQPSSPRKYTSPWFNHECEIARSELKRANRDFRKHKTQVLHEVLLQKRKQYSKIKRRAQSVYKQNERKRLHDLASSNPKAFWSEIKRFTDSKTNSCNVSLQAFYDHFKQIYSESSHYTLDFVDEYLENNLSSNDSVDTDQYVNFTSLDSPITREEVLKAFAKLKRNKSPGLDLLPPELFIDSVDLLCDPICKLFNHIFSKNCYPLSWTKGVIVPVPKKGDLTDVNNYRGITLTSIFSKLYSHILDNRLRSWSEDNNIINDNQFGFREGKSTVDCIYILQAIVNKMLNNKKKVYCAFVDFKKAFDLVYRNGIWFKLCKMGANLKIVNAIKAIYNSVKVCVRAIGKVSECFDSLVGVKQGEPLSPILFIVFLNDLAEELSINNNYFEDNGDIIEQFQKFILLFADDTMLLANTKLELQLLLNKLCTYCKTWNLTVNTNKTKVMIFSRSNRHEQVEIFYDETLLEIVNTFIYLGVNVSSNGKFYQSQKHLSEQASKALFALRKLFDSNLLCIKDKLKLFDSLVQPILMYGSEIWGFHKADDIEKVHIKFLKQLLGVRRQTNNIAVYGELGRFPLFVLRKIRILKYWYKVINSQGSLLHKVYTQQLNDLNRGLDDNNWAFQVMSLLNNLGFTYIWNTQNITKMQLNMVIQCVYDQYCQSWYESINSSSKLETLKCLNKVFGFEKYLSCITVDGHRIALTRFRCSAHKLMIEEGRYRNIERNSRICQFCNLNVIENEYHFLLVCPAYRDIRTTILPNYYCRWPTKNKFINLLNDNQSGILKKLGKFLYQANVKR